MCAAEEEAGDGDQERRGEGEAEEECEEGEAPPAADGAGEQPPPAEAGPDETVEPTGAASGRAGAAMNRGLLGA